jgi:hypothetical protein
MEAEAKANPLTSQPAQASCTSFETPLGEKVLLSSQGDLTSTRIFRYSFFLLLSALSKCEQMSEQDKVRRISGIRMEFALKQIPKSSSERQDEK